MFPESNLPWWHSDRPWGFRFSTMDVAILVGGLFATILLWFSIDEFALIVPYLLANFFLFCNLFRVGGERSLFWAISFLINAACWPLTQNTWIHLGIQQFITGVLVVHCLLSKDYHGIGCARWNPDHFHDGAMTEGALTRRILNRFRCPKRFIEVLVGRRLDEFEK